MRLSLYLCFFLVMGLFGGLLAQAPAVLSVSPANMAIVDPSNLEIQIDFDRALDLSTVDLSNFKVSGRWTGPRKGLTFSMANEDKTVKLLLDTEDDPFNAGEWVTVYLTKGIQASDGENLAKGYVWNFWIQTKAASMEMLKLKTIELRRSGEGLLQAYGAYAGDLDNDHFTDLTVVNETSDDLRILLNDGTGDYTTDGMTILPMGSATPSPNEGADFNGDGDIDLAVCTAHDNELRVLFGDGEGSFYQQDNYTTGQNARGLVVLDFNGDGAEDILIVNRGSSNMSLFTNDGFGAFTVSTIDPDPNGFGESGLVAADINNDGIQDLFVGNFTSQDIVSFLGDGDGGFYIHDKVTLTGANQPWMMCVGDFDGDGFADVASANSNGHGMSIHINDGTGKFAKNTSASAPQGLFPLAIDAGDIDGDGDLDLVTSNYQSATFTIFENDGTGDFSTSITTLPSSDKASCAILHDRDNDGDLDITATDEGLDHVILFDNVLTASAVSESQAIVQELDLSPNPFAEQLLLEFSLEATATISVQVRDAQGKILRELWSGKMAEGRHQLAWNGRDAAGHQLANGVYFVQLISGERVLSRQVLKLGRE